jgi:hypothetical protein
MAPPNLPFGEEFLILLKIALFIKKPFPLGRAGMGYKKSPLVETRRL